MCVRVQEELWHFQLDFILKCIINDFGILMCEGKFPQTVLHRAHGTSDHSQQVSNREFVNYLSAFREVCSPIMSEHTSGLSG